LDYCCGNGETALYLAEQGAESWGIDISSVSVENAKKAAEDRNLSDRVTFRVMDAECMEFGDGFFDIVVVNGVLHHLELDRAYSELARVLKDDGEIICTEALRHNPIIHFYRKLTPHVRTAWETQHILGKREIGRAKAYFKRVEVARFFHLTTLLAVPFRGSAAFPVALRMLEAGDRLLLSLPLVKWQAWMAVFTLAEPKRVPRRFEEER
jgi:ubiquinone/menaquinone biosynthesis C-methylase UbiE